MGRVLGGRYRVLSRLGEGGMGTVYLCEHAVLERRYAVKVLRPDLAQDPELAERFRNEAIAASRVGGGNVVDVLDFGTSDDGALYFVMEALEGRSLGAVIADEGPLEVARALGLLEQICRALAAAHARGVVHRDVKPDNIFVVRRDDGSEWAKVIDFGISKVTLEGASAERLTRAGTIIGTPEYMAPEQAAGDPVDHRADVYALGVLAYEMLTGTLPILANTPIATLVAHQTRTPQAPSARRPGIPREVDALVLAALAKRPQDRPASMDALAAAIAEIRAGPLSPPLLPTLRVERGEISVSGQVGAAPPRARSRPGVTVALPESRRRFRMRSKRRAAALAGTAALAGAVALAVAALLARAPRRPVAAAAVVRPAAPAAVPVPVAAPAAPPAPPSRAGESDGTAAPPRRAPARPPRQPPRDEHLEDPYGAGGLKPDPFR